MAEPGDPGWKWFPDVKANWSLDVVALLAVIGESAIAEHSQTITASLLCMLPRLLPAPQALLKPSRPARLPETKAKLTGVYSGTTLDSVGFFANIITPLEGLAPYSFQVLEIRHAHAHADAADAADAALPPRRGSSNARSDRWESRLKSLFGFGKLSSSPSPSPVNALRLAPGRDIESGLNQQQQQPQEKTPTTNIDPLRRRPTAKDRVQDLLSSGTLSASSDKCAAVPPKLFSPIHILSLFSCALSVAIIIAAALWQDGAAILAVFLISSASTVVGYASCWRPILMRRVHTNPVPRGDVMIRTREGAFVLVRCSEDVARELYSGTEECRYYVRGRRAHRLLMALGTTLLMLSVVLLGNCTWNSQVFISAAYIVLNGLYWGLGMIPRSYFWDLSRYESRCLTPEDASRAHCKPEGGGGGEEDQPSFTRTLWYAIRETKAIGWVERSGAAPGTPQWKKWLDEALEHAHQGKDWPAVRRKSEIMEEGEKVDRAAQHAPATEVQGFAKDPAWGHF